MASIVFELPDGERIEHRLEEGVNTLGRDGANSLVLDDPSVAPEHCRITVSEASAVLAAAGPECDVSVDGESAQTCELRPGQVVQVGEYIFEFQWEDAECEDSIMCMNHPDAHADWACTKCGKNFCSRCVDRRMTKGKRYYFCRNCLGVCRPLSFGGAVDADSQTNGVSFFGELKKAFSYPLYGDSIFILIVGALFFWVFDTFRMILNQFPLLGLIGAFIFVLTTGYLFAFMKDIMLTSAYGEDELPAWPEFENFFEDMIRPYLMLAAALIMSFAPLAIFMILSADMGDAFRVSGIFAAVGIGLLYFPMALLAMSIADSFMALNPVIVILSIAKIGAPYIGVVLILSLIVLIRLFGGAVCQAVIPYELVSSLLINVFSIYCFCVYMRILGRMYYKYSGRLGWL